MQIRIYMDEAKWTGGYWQGTKTPLFLNRNFYENGDPSCFGTHHSDFDLTLLMMDLSEKNSVLQAVLNEKAIVGSSIVFSAVDWKLNKEVESNKIFHDGDISIHKNFSRR